MKIDQQLLEHYISRHTADVLSAVEILPVEEIVGILESVPTESAAILISKMERLKAAKCLEKLKPGLAVEIIAQLSVTNSEILLRLVSADFCSLLLDELPEKIAQNLRRILRYPKNTVGANLNPIVFTINEEFSVKMALDKIVKEKPQLQSYLYVLDRNQLLVGYIELKKLITTEGSKSIKSMMNLNPPKIIATINISSLADSESWIESFSELPVVDVDGIFLGILSKDTLRKFDPVTNAINQNVYKSGAALGELFKIGLVSFLKTTSEISTEQNLK
jgi:magnesium transporter